MTSGRFYYTTLDGTSRTPAGLETYEPPIVMKIGGWEDYAVLEPYLSNPSLETTFSEFETAGLA